MATETITRLIDDIDGQPAARTVRFSMDNDTYEIDLTAEHEAELASLLAPWVKAARKVPATRRTTRTVARAATSKQDLDAIRAWAKANGHDIADRGRIPASVVDAYHARATPESRPPAAKKTTARTPARKATRRTAAKSTAAKKAPAKKPAASA